MIQVICPKCKGKGKVPCPICNENKEVKENIVENNNKQDNKEKECKVCDGTGEVLCTACMGGGIMDTSAFA